MFEQLMQLPLFQGVSAQQLSTLVEKMPFHFLKYSDGEPIIAAGDTCTHVKFVVSGRVRVNVQFRDLQVTIAQTMSAPNVLGPDYLFGLETVYPFSVTAQGKCGILQLRKADYVTMVQSDKVFLFNILNFLSRNSQRFTSGLLSLQQGSLSHRLGIMLAVLTLPSSTEVSISFVQKDLCALLGTQRATLMQTLERLQADGAITYTASEITILDSSKL